MNAIQANKRAAALTAVMISVSFCLTDARRIILGLYMPWPGILSPEAGIEFHLKKDAFLDFIIAEFPVGAPEIAPGDGQFQVFYGIPCQPDIHHPYTRRRFLPALFGHCAQS